MHRVSNHPTIWILTALALGLATVLALPAGAEELTIPLTDPDRPVELSVHSLSGVVTVEGYDGREVRIEAGPDGEAEDEEETESQAHEGMRRIPNRSFGLTASEENNRVKVDLKGADVRRLTLLVPRDTSVEVDTVNGGRVTVRGVRGSHDVKNVNGGILLEDVSGTVLAHTTNGGVSVSLERPDPGKPMSFVTLNGDVELTLPGDFGADLRLKTTNGDIFTDFDFIPTPGEPTIREKSEGGRYKVEVEREVQGSINGGGPEIRMQTFNGDVLVRKGG